MCLPKTFKGSIKATAEPSTINWEDLISDFPVNPFVTADWLESLKTPNRKPVFIKFSDYDKIIAISAGLIIESQYPLVKQLSRRLFCLQDLSLLPHVSALLMKLIRP